MNARSIFSIILVLLIAGFFIYSYLSQPTPQEKAVIAFFDNVRQGNEDKADKYLVDQSYGKFMDKSKVFDTDGTDLKKVFSEGRDPIDIETLDNIARASIPLIKASVPKFEVESIQTQRIKSEPDHSYVQFSFAFRVKEALDQPSIPGKVYGSASLRRISKKWLIESGEFTIKIQGRSIKKYMDYYSY